MKIGIVLALWCLISSNVIASDVSKVNVTRQEQDLYKVEYQKIYIKTRYCYEYVHYNNAVLRIDNRYGYNIGKIIFSNGRSCDVQKILK
jgi:hypothetical protein